MSDPIIRIEPVSVDYSSDSGVTYANTGVPVPFSVLYGVPGVNYQWYLNGTLVCTGTKYTLENPVEGDKIYVTSSDCCGSCSIIKIVNNYDEPSILNVGMLRYGTSGNTSYFQVCMQTGASTYSWIDITGATW